MPVCGSQITLCDVPIRYDTYKGCGHACSYCFVTRKANIAVIENGESATSLLSFIKGKRDKSTNWCDWDIPIHWGGMSDPFQPIEKVRGRSLEALKVFAETQYPFIVSTKSALIATEPYLSLIRQCNCVVQFSLCSPKYDKIERGASSYADRLRAAEEIAKYKRVNLRVQPYMPVLMRDIITQIPEWAKVGIHGIILEAMKYNSPKVENLVRIGNDMCYPLSVLLPQYQAIKTTCHKYGLKFYSGENRLRALSDSLCCCGVEDMGWRVNTANLNHYLFDRENFVYTEKQKEVGTALVFSAMNQNTIDRDRLSNQSYSQEMNTYLTKPYSYTETSQMFTKEQGNRLRIYLCDCLAKSGLTKAELIRKMGNFMPRHYFTQSQWEFPTKENYEKLKQFLPHLMSYEECLVKVGGLKNIVRAQLIYGLKK